MPARKKNITFDEYKTVKDEIIKISEERFENLLTQRLKEFKIELINDLSPRFESLEKQMAFIKWFLPAFIGIMMIILKFVKV